MKQLSTFFCLLAILCTAPAPARIVREDDTEAALITTSKKRSSAPKKDATPQKTTKKSQKAQVPPADQTRNAAPTSDTPETPEVCTPTISSEIEQKIKAVQAAAEKEAELLYKKAETKVAIITRQEALKRLATQQEVLSKELAQLQPDEPDTASEATVPAGAEAVTTQWKIRETAKFNRLSTELSDTVNAGESDDSELHEFAQLFDDQRTWFDTTMTATRYVGDDSYKAIVERNKRLEALVKAQKRAMPIFTREINVKKISKSDYDRAATILLYDLNALLLDPYAWNGTIPEDDNAILKVVRTAIQESRDASFAKPSPAQKTLRQLTKKLHETQRLIEERNKKVLELEITLGTNEDKLQTLKKHIEELSSAKKDSEEQLKSLKDKSEQDITALKAEKTKIESDLEQAKTDAKTIQAKLDTLSSDASKTSQEKTSLQNQARDLSNKIDDLQDKKRSVEHNLDEEQHKRRELELEVEQTKFKQEQAEKDSQKLESENTRLASVRRELADQIDSKNKHILDLNLKLEHLRRELNAQNQTSAQQAAEIVATMKKDFEQQIHDLKMVMLKRDKASPADLKKEEDAFKAEVAQEEAETKKALQRLATSSKEIPLIDDAAALTDIPQSALFDDGDDAKAPSIKSPTTPPEIKNGAPLAKKNSTALSNLERKNLADRNKRALSDIEKKVDEYLKKRGITPHSAKGGGLKQPPGNGLKI